MTDKKEDDKPIKTLTAEDIRLLKTVSGDFQRSG
jgi:acyl dehydratase